MDPAPAIALLRTLGLNIGSNDTEDDAGLQLTASSLMLSLDQLDRKGLDNLCYDIVCPFYWIESTGVLLNKFHDFLAQQAGFGVLAKREKPSFVPMFPN